MPKHPKKLDEKNLKEIEELSKKYDIDIKILKSIVKDFGSISEFKYHFIENAINEGPVYYQLLVKNYTKKLNGKIVQAFDLNSKDLICRANNYLAFNNVENFPIFYDVEEYKKATIDKIKKFTIKNVKIIKSFYGLDVPKQSSIEIAAETGLNSASINNTVRTVTKKYNSEEAVTDGIYKEYDMKQRSQFLKTFFQNHDIFYTPEEQELQFKDDMVDGILKENFIIYKNKIENNNNETGIKRMLSTLNTYKSNIVSIQEQLAELKMKRQWNENKKLLTELENIEKKLNKITTKDDYVIKNSNEFTEIFKEYKDLERRCTPIENIGLFDSTSNSLKREGVLFLNILIKEDTIYVQLLKWVYPSQKEAIINAVHSLGYQFANEKKATEEISKAREQIAIKDKDEELQIKNEELEKIKNKIQAKIDVIEEDSKPYNIMNGIQKAQKNDMEDWQRAEFEKLQQEIKERIVENQDKKLTFRDRIKYIERKQAINKSQQSTNKNEVGEEDERDF